MLSAVHSRALRPLHNKHQHAYWHRSFSEHPQLRDGVRACICHTYIYTYSVLSWCCHSVIMWWFSQWCSGRRAVDGAVDGAAYSAVDGAVMVQRWCSDGAAMVQSWCSHGAVIYILIQCGEWHCTVMYCDDYKTSVSTCTAWNHSSNSRSSGVPRMHAYVMHVLIIIVADLPHSHWVL